MPLLIALLSIAMKGVLSDPPPAAETPHVAIPGDAAPSARAEETPLPESVHVALTLPPVEHVCDIGIQPWPDASNPVPFATGPTATHDGQELWAASSSAALVTARYADGVLRLFVLGIPMVVPQPPIEFTSAGWRPKWPLC